MNIDKINAQVARVYPLSLPAKHLETRIPSTLTMNRVLMYYTVWNWLILGIALVTRYARIVLYAQASTLLIACIILVAWATLRFPFFEQFYSRILRTETAYLIVLADVVVHFFPVALIGLPSRLALPVFMPFLTFWVWYMAMRPHMKTLYGSPGGGSSFAYDSVATGGTVVWLAALVVIQMRMRMRA